MANRRLAKQDMESALLARGWRCRERVKFDMESAKGDQRRARKCPRFTYRRDQWRILTESEDQPFWTLQKTNASDVIWFVDFPMDVPLSAIFTFLEAC